MKRLEKEFSERQKKMKEEKAEQLRKKFQKDEEARQKKLDSRIQQANDICYWGLMQSEKQLDQAMVGLTKSKQLEFLKAQLKFRKKFVGTESK